MGSRGKDFFRAPARLAHRADRQRPVALRQPPPGGIGQQRVMPVVGFLNGASAWEYTHLAAAFRQGLSETGYVDGRNVLVEYRWAEGTSDCRLWLLIWFAAK